MLYQGEKASFSFNKSSHKVEAIGKEVLSSVEYVVLNEIMPIYCDKISEKETYISLVDAITIRFSWKEEERKKVKKLIAIKGNFPGLSSLLATYFNIIKKYKIDTGDSFLLAVKKPLTLEVLRAIYTIWGPARGGDPKAYVPQSLILSLYKIVEYGSKEEKEMALKCLEYMQKEEAHK